MHRTTAKLITLERTDAFLARGWPEGSQAVLAAQAKALRLEIPPHIAAASDRLKAEHKGVIISMKKPANTASASTRNKIAAALTGKPTLRQTFIMANRHGLHARPCALLVKTLRPFACQVEVESDGMIANANSLLGLMSLAAGFESKLTFIISGGAAARAMAAVQRLFETQFEEAYAVPENMAVAQ